ncbi:phosphotyrosyl phosphate activator [Zopfochytrium polystomum]|nr:phosphotyrosyl phosphate activator [Zopfochytrium polystomum]
MPPPPQPAPAAGAAGGTEQPPQGGAQPQLPPFAPQRALARFARLAAASRATLQATTTRGSDSPFPAATAATAADVDSDAFSSDPSPSSYSSHPPPPPPATPQALAAALTAPPTRRILDAATDMPRWLRSEALSRYLDFVQLVNLAVTGKKNEDARAEARIVKLVAMLDQVEAWIADIPPQESPQRFGNKAFRTWHQRLETSMPTLLAPIVPAALHAALGPYLLAAFGHPTRLDYGSGHELSFLCFVCALCVAGVLRIEEDALAVGCVVFVRYLDVVRRLQVVYSLEPAGSHGVWGLDDFQFLCYYWGAAQMIGHPHAKPKSVLSPDTVSHLRASNMYFGAIAHILSTKSGPFHEHSPILYDISGVPRWEKVNAGMLKMYRAEVVEKFPVVQHLVFGGYLPFEDVAREVEEAEVKEVAAKAGRDALAPPTVGEGEGVAEVGGGGGV